MEPDPDREAEHVVVRWDGELRHLAFVVYYGDERGVADAFLTDPAGRLAWTRSAADTAALAARAGYLGADAEPLFAVQEQTDLDGLIDVVTDPTPRAECRRLLAAWELFDQVAETTGRPFAVSTADEALHDALTVAAHGGSWWARLWSRPARWEAGQLVHLRHVMTTGTQLVRHYLAPEPSTAVRPVRR